MCRLSLWSTVVHVSKITFSLLGFCFLFLMNFSLFLSFPLQIQFLIFVFRMSDVAEEKAEFLVIRTYGSESFRKECADLIVSIQFSFRKIEILIFFRKKSCTN